MLGPMGARIIDILKIMTPNEIDSYIEKPQKEVTADIKKAAGGEDFDVTHSPAQSGRKLKKDENQQQDDQANQEPEHQAKIIPLNKESSEHLAAKENEENEDQSLESEIEDEKEFHHNDKAQNELEQAGIMSAAKIEALKRKRLNELKKKQDSTTNFIIKQREKLKKTKVRLIEMEAIKNYNINSNIDKLNDEIDIDNPEEEVSIGSKGILVNKKHY